MFQKFEYKVGRTFVVGDIHGEFGLLDKGLANHGFDPNIDNVFSVGDLVDRGPASPLALIYLSQPWFHAVRGNHEQMTIDAGGTFWHCQNGGAWFNDDLNDEQRLKFVEAFKKLPLVIQFETPTGRQIGVAHASFWPNDWAEVQEAIDNLPRFDDDGHALLWDRQQIRSSAHGEIEPCKGIDHIYMGHTPTKIPITSGNRSWIDTGAFATGKLIIEEVL